VKVHLRIESGARSGETLVFERDRISVGRHPTSELRFDAERDLEVSTRHAIIVRQGHRWFVRDLGSRNGTFLNGAPVVGDQDIGDGDRIAFGLGGPTVVLHLPSGSSPAAPLATVGTTAIGAQPDPASQSGETTRIRSRVDRETRKLKLLVGGLALALVTVVVVLVATNDRQRSAWERERTEMLRAVDSLLAVGVGSMASLEGELDGVAQAFAASESEVRRLGAALEEARSQDRTDSLRVQLQAATVALGQQQLAAAIDFQTIERQSGPAVASIWVDFGEGDVRSATAFLVGAGGLLMTSRHVVHGPANDRRPDRLAVRFSGSPGTWPAEVVAASPDWDLALVRVTGPGTWPDAVRFNARADTVSAGRPLVLIGFPLGGDLPEADAAATLARPITSTGVLLQWRPERLELRGYGAEGASGSPVFDERGEVVGILQGRLQGAAEALAAVPAAAALGFIENQPEAR